MPNINWGNYNASADNGGFEKLPAGGYVARIVSAEYKPDRMYTEFVFDIAEGEHAGFYSDAWGQSHPYTHHFFLSYKETALPMTKGRLEAFNASNPGFDAMAASNADRFELFVGRTIGINLQEEEYETRDGEVRKRLNVCQVVPAQDVRDGKVKPRDLKKLSRPAAATTSDVATSAAVYNGAIPF